MIKTLIYVAILLILLAASWRRPAAAVGVVLCMFGIEQYGQSVSYFFVKHAALTNIVIGSIATIALMRKGWRSNSRWMSYGPIGWLVIALYFYALVSTVWAPQPNFSFDYYIREAPYIVLLIFIVPLIIVSYKDLDVAINTVVMIGFVFTVLLLFFVDWSGRSVVVAGVFNKYGDRQGANPLAAAEMAGYTALTAGLYFYGTKTRTWGFLKWGALIFSVILTVKTGSRGQALFLIVVLIVFWPLRNRVDIKSFFSVVAPAIISVFAFKFAVDSFWGGTQRWSSEHLSGDLSERVLMAESLLNTWWNSSPLTILFGLGNSASFDPKIVGYYPHIVPLEIVGEEGLVGFAVYIMIIIKTISAVLRLINNNNLRHRRMGVVLGALFFYTFLLSLKQGSFLGSPVMFSIAVLIGKADNISALITKRRQYEARRAVNPKLTPLGFWKKFSE